MEENNKDNNKHNEKNVHQEHHKKDHENKSHEHKEHKAHLKHQKNDDSHHKPHHAKKAKSSKICTKTGPWKIISGILAILLIISIFSHGFTFNNNSVEAIAAQMNDLATTTQSPELRAGLDDLKEDVLELSQYQETEKSKVSGNIVKQSDEAVKVDFYVMSQCPYGTQVVDAVAPLIDKFGDNLDLNLNYIATENPDGSFRSLHGEPEVKGNIVQLCAIEHEPNNYMDMLVCMNKNARNIPDNWESCAEETGLDVEAIRTCYEGEEGKKLLSENVKLAQEVGATGSPTIYVNDEKYTGGRATNEFFRGFCQAFDKAPAVCDEIPEPKEVNMILINDKRCEECDTSQLLPSLKQLFPGLEISQYDYTDLNGKKLYQELELTNLPAILFDDSVKEGAGYAQVQQFLKPVGEYQMLAIGAQFDPTKEICDNGKDDTDNGKVDCEDEDCKDAMVCREEKENNVQAFIMSDCPYGREAIKALKEFSDNFEDADIEVHYIASETDDGFNSLHGQYEVDENIVQLCVEEYSSDEWMDYIYCRSTKGVKGKDWKECAEETNVDIDAVETCFEGDEGKELLNEDIKIAQSLQIGASPTWLANNKYKFQGITADAIQQNFCEYNEHEDCDNVELSSESAVPSGQC